MPHLLPGFSGIVGVVVIPMASWMFRSRAWTLWEGWRGYDVNKYQAALRDAFKPLEHYAGATPALRFP